MNILPTDTHETERVSFVTKLWRSITNRKRTIEKRAVLKLQKKHDAQNADESTNIRSETSPEKSSGAVAPATVHGLQCTCGSYNCSGSLIRQYTLAMENGDTEKCRFIREGLPLPPPTSSTEAEESSVTTPKAVTTDAVASSRPRGLTRRESPESDNTGAKLKTSVTVPERKANVSAFTIMSQPVMAGVPQIGFLCTRRHGGANVSYKSQPSKPDVSHGTGQLSGNNETHTFNESVTPECLGKTLKNTHLLSDDERDNLKNHVSLISSDTADLPASGLSPTDSDGASIGIANHHGHGDCLDDLDEHVQKKPTAMSRFAAIRRSLSRRKQYGYKKVTV